MKYKLVISLLWLLCLNGPNSWGQTPTPLKVSADGRYLQDQDGQRFFWLGDTAWELFSRLTLEEIKAYLDNRAAKGFNVIQVTCLSENDAGQPNRYGSLPLLDKDRMLPNPLYFAIVDSALTYAAERQMYLALVATWGDNVVSGKFDTRRAAQYGRWLGEHFKKYDNIIWIMGGDRKAVDGESDYRPVWRALANGIIESSGHKWLMTYHPNGERSSSEWVHNEPWLDFNMIQSSHGRKDAPVWGWVGNDRSLSPTKPTLDSEPNYEDHPVSPWPKWHVDNGYFRDYDVRKQLYRSVFAGGFGVTYGHHAIWQFFNERVEAINHVDRGWVNAMDRPGAYQAGYLRKLMESRPSTDLVPATELILHGPGESAERMEAVRDAEGKFIMVYLPVTKTIELDLSGLNSRQIVAWWYNPQTGKAVKAGILPREARMSFTPREAADHPDWVLVDPKMKYGEPGQ